MPDESVLARAILESFPGNKIAAIKLLREHTGLGLAEAKEAIDRLWTDLQSAQSHGMLNDDLVTISLRRSNALGGAPLGESAPSGEMKFDLTRFLPDRKIDAIKYVREETGLGLKEAKDLVEQQWPAGRTATSPEYEVRSSGAPLVVWIGLIVIAAAAAWYFLSK